jgi:predicted nuclease of predicted toxin-antitoxin system
MKKIKLDENFPPAAVEIFQAQQIDASSVFKQRLQGSEDDKIFSICKNEGRILVTFDLDFANIIRYPAYKSPGIIIVRSRKKLNINSIKSLCKKLVKIISENETKSN